MSTYQIGVVHYYLVTIEAETSDDAKRLASSFIGYKDESNEYERDENKFNIEDIEIVESDSFLVN